MVIETYNIQLKMDEAGRVHWLNVLNQSRNAFNRCAELLFEKKTLSLKIAHSMCYNTVRTEFPCLSSQMAIKCEQAALAAIKSIRSNKHKNVECPYRKALAMILDKRLYGKFTATGIELTGKEKRKRNKAEFVLYPKATEMLLNHKACDPSIFYRNGEFYLSVPFEVPERPVLSDSCIGVDLGMRQLFVTSEGKSFRDAEYLGRRRKVRYMKSKLQSKGTKSAKRHLKKLKKHEANQSKDMCYRAAKALIKSTSASIIVMEDLSKIKQNTSKNEQGQKRTGHNNALSQVPFYKFKQIMAYKAPLAGKQVETVSPMYTSQTDSRTGKVEGERRGRRFYCKDGIVFDADWNAAINIGQKSKHPLSSELPLDGTLKPLRGRCLSTHQSWKRL
jgi:putative transposase